MIDPRLLRDAHVTPPFIACSIGLGFVSTLLLIAQAWLLGGDLMARFVADAESLQDPLVRVISPFAIALLIGVATIALLWWILPAAGLIMAAALLLAATALLWTTARLAARREAGQAKARCELTAAVLDLTQGAPELVAYDGADRYLARAGAIDEELARIERKTARTAGVGQGFATLLPAAAMLGSLVVGITAVRGGRLDIAFLAVISCSRRCCCSWSFSTATYTGSGRCRWRPWSPTMCAATSIATRRRSIAAPDVFTGVFDASGAQPRMVVRSPTTGAIQAIDVRGVVQWARRHEFLIVFSHTIGDFVPAGAALIETYGGAGVEPRAELKLRLSR